MVFNMDGLVLFLFIFLLIAIHINHKLINYKIL